MAGLGSSGGCFLAGAGGVIVGNSGGGIFVGIHAVVLRRNDPVGVGAAALDEDDDDDAAESAPLRNLHSQQS